MHNILPRYQAGSLQILGDIAERGMGAEMENERTVVVGRDGVEKKDGSAKQRFNDEPDVSINPSFSTSPGTLSDSDPEDEYWEVEDVWEEDDWLRGDGEDGGIISRRNGSSLSLNLSEFNKSAKVVPSTLTPLDDLPSSPYRGASYRHRSPDTRRGRGYFLNIIEVPRRVKSTTSLLSAFRGSSHYRDFTYAKSLDGSPSSLSPQPQPRNPSGPSVPITPTSTPNMELESPFASCAFSSCVSGPRRRSTGLKNTIVSLSSD